MAAKITVPDSFPAAPPGFPELTRTAAETAFAAVRDALQPELAVPRLLEYYDKTGNYAGKTFVEMLAGPSTAPDEFTAADLYALTLLKVPAPSARATRAFLDPGDHRNKLTDFLHGLGDANDLGLADEDTLLAMEQLYLRVRGTLGMSATGDLTGRPWVTASKLCARKRPGLFPVRDNLTCDLLGVLKVNDYRIDWQIFRLLMLPESGVPDALMDLQAEALQRNADQTIQRGAAKGNGRLAMDTYPLRWLDVALWMHARATTTVRRATPTGT